MILAYQSLKAYADRIASFLAIIVLFPIFIIVFLLVIVCLGSPPFFSQVRPGYRGKPFRILKFRTMNQARDGIGSLLPDAQRLVPLGKWLRAASIDELPSLVNILRGEMSFVGPRPLLMRYLDLYSSEQFRRHDVKPGLTGWAQVNGRNAISWEEKFRLDIWYVDHQSFWLDLRILLLTIWKVIRREGISAAGESTMAPFTGTAVRE